MLVLAAFSKIDSSYRRSLITHYKVVIFTYSNLKIDCRVRGLCTLTYDVWAGCERPIQPAHSSVPAPRGSRYTRVPGERERRFKVKNKGQGHQADIMLRSEVHHIFRTERPTNFKLGVQMEDEDPYRRDGPSPARSKVKVAMSRGAPDRCWLTSLERKFPETSKLLSRLRMPRVIMRTSFKVKRSTVKLDYCWD